MQLRARNRLEFFGIVLFFKKLSREKFKLPYFKERLGFFEKISLKVENVPILFEKNQNAPVFVKAICELV
jgi:hypothetical protein